MMPAAYGEAVMVRRRKRSESFGEVLLQAPWQVSIVVGVGVFVGLKWILPSTAAGNMFLKPMAQAFSGLAWLFSGIFFLLGAVVFFKQAVSRHKQTPQVSTKTLPSRDPISAWKPPPWANADSKERQEPSEGKETPSTPNSQVIRGVLGEPVDVNDSLKSPPSENFTKPVVWSIEVIREVEWKRFEDVCQKYYELKGIRSESTPLGPDGGIDIRLYQDGTGMATSVVQCKAWGERVVGVKPVRELLGVMTHEKIDKSFFMTSGRFSDEAKEIAKANRITLIDGEMLLMMFKRLPEAAQQTLLAFATEGDYRIPTCPSCGIKMRRIGGKAGRSDFWGCHNYPRCRQKLGVRRDL